jgi:hypothetical protein
MAFQHFRLDEGIGPQGIQKLVMRYQSSWMLNEIAQKTKCLGRQRDTLGIFRAPEPPKALVHGIQPERRELLHVYPANP